MINVDRVGERGREASARMLDAEARIPALVERWAKALCEEIDGTADAPQVRIHTLSFTER